MTSPSAPTRCAVLVTATLRQEAVADYDDAHLEVPAAVLEVMRTARVDDWTIWREGLELRQIIIAADRAAIDDALTRQPSSWSDVIAAMVEPGSSRVTEVTLCWTLRNGVIFADS